VAAPANREVRQRITDPVSGVPLAPNEVQQRRLRSIEEADLPLRGASRLTEVPMPGRDPLPPAAAAFAAPPPAATGALARTVWTVLGSIFLVIVGLAVGYFWFGPGRG
jgi:hypothetical protein